MSDTISEATSAAAVEKKPSIIRRLYDWVLHWADTPYGLTALCGLSFAESSVFPVPPDPLLIALAVAKPKRSFFYAAACTVASVLGGLAGYALGFFVWVQVKSFFLKFVFSEELFAKVGTLYHDNAFLAILGAGFTPIPYKVFTVSAGVFEVSLATFLVASLIGRSARFFLVAGLIWKFGAQIRRRIEAHFDLFAILFMVLFVLGVVVVKVFIKGH